MRRLVIFLFAAVGAYSQTINGISVNSTLESPTLAPGVLQLGATDTGLSRGAAGQILIGNGAEASQSGELVAATVSGATFSTQNWNVLNSTGFGMGSAQQVTWKSAASTTTVSGGDIGLSRVAAGGLGVGNGTAADVSGTLQSGVTATDPGCTTTAHVGKLWFNVTTTTTEYRKCLNVNGTVNWATTTGTGSEVFSTSPTLVTPLLGTPASGVATNLTGLPLTTGVTGTLPVANGGTGATASTGTGNVVLAGSPTIITPIVSGVVSSYNGRTTAGNGLASVLGYATAAASSASIGTTNLLAAATVGLYRISSYAATSSAGTGTVILTIGWTDAVGAKTLALPTLTKTAGTFVQATTVVQSAAAANITYATTNTTSGAYNLYITVERIQ